MSEETKQCASCGATKQHGEFHRNAARPDGLASICRECQRERDQARRKAYLSRSDDEIEFPAEQRCGECGEVKPAAAFSRNRGKKSGLSNSCRTCKTASARKRRARNASRTGFAPVPEKKCSRCGEVKKAGEFALCRGAACGLQGMCRSCSREDAAERRRKK